MKMINIYVIVLYKFYFPIKKEKNYDEKAMLNPMKIITRSSSLTHNFNEIQSSMFH